MRKRVKYFFFFVNEEGKNLFCSPEKKIGRIYESLAHIGNSSWIDFQWNELVFKLDEISMETLQKREKERIETAIVSEIK